MPLATEGLPSTASFDNVHLVLQSAENRAQVIKDTAAIATFVITNKDKSITASYTVDFKNEGTVKLGEYEGKKRMLTSPFTFPTKVSMIWPPTKPVPNGSFSPESSRPRAAY